MTSFLNTLLLDSREMREQRFWVCDHADRHTGADLIAENVPLESTILYTDEWQRYHGSYPVNQGVNPPGRELPGVSGTGVEQDRRSAPRA